MLRRGAALVFVDVLNSVAVRVGRGIGGVLGVEAVGVFPHVGHAIVVIVSIRIVADSVPVSVRPFGRVVRKCVGGVVIPVTIGVSSDDTVQCYP